MPEKESALLALIKRSETQSTIPAVEEQHLPESNPIREGFVATAEVFSKGDGIDSPVSGVIGSETYRERFDRLFGANNWEIHQESPVVMRVIVAETQHYTPTHAQHLGGEALRHAS